jgi:hypothetical protein
LDYNKNTRRGGYNKKPPVQFVAIDRRLGGNESIIAPFDSAVSEIEGILTDPLYAEDMAMMGLRTFLKSMAPAGPDGKKLDSPVPIDDIVEMSESQSPVRLWDFYTVTRPEFAHLTRYVMSNTRLQIEEQEGRDPRLDLITRLGGDL